MLRFEVGSSSTQYILRSCHMVYLIDFHFLWMDYFNFCEMEIERALKKHANKARRAYVGACAWWLARNQNLIKRVSKSTNWIEEWTWSAAILFWRLMELVSSLKTYKKDTTFVSSSSDNHSRGIVIRDWYWSIWHPRWRRWRWARCWWPSCWCSAATWWSRWGRCWWRWRRRWRQQTTAGWRWSCRCYKGRAATTTTAKLPTDRAADKH